MDKEAMIYNKLCNFIDKYRISCSEDVVQRDSVNLECSDFVAELVAIMLEE